MPPPDEMPTLLVADPHPAVCEGLPLLLRDEALLVVATASTAATAETLTVSHDPDVVLLGEGLPDAPMPAALARLLRHGQRAAVVVYVEGEESDHLAEAVRSGAAGVVSRLRPVAQLARALRAVASGRTWFNESDWVDAPLTAAAERSVRSEGLSDSERRVLALVAAGASTEEVGASLGVSPHTVRTHVRNLMRKLDAQSRAHAVAIAMQEAAIDVEMG